MLSVHGIYSGYGESEVLHGIDLTIQARETVALVGANGVGKSTLLRTVSGLLGMSRGKIVLNGINVTGLRPHVLVKYGLCHSPENRRVWPQMTVYETLRTGGWTLGSRKRVREQIVRMFDLFPKLSQRYRQLAGTLSGGEQQMLAVARAMMPGPQVLLLDEPTLGLSPIMVSEVMSLVGAIRDEGVSMLLVEQNAAVALKNTDRAYIMESGRISNSGYSTDLLNDENIRSAYLGVA